GHDSLAVLGEQLLIGFVPVGPFPARGLEKEGAQRLFSLIERTDPHPPVRFPLLARMDDAVGLVEALGAAPANVRLRLLMVVEARDIRAGRIDPRDARRE